MAYLSSYKFWNKVFYVIRILLVVLPLHGYIHPDEYFQSIEVMANDIFKYKAVRTWEWNTTTPIRNLLFPMLSTGLPYWIMKQMKHYLNFEMSAYLLLVAPRLVMLACVLITEKMLTSLYGIDKYYKPSASLGLFLFRSSHVVLVFLTRTFSNSFETMFFTTLLYFAVCKLKDNLQFSLLRDSTIGFLVATGIFVRPSFLAYAFYPGLHLVVAILLKFPIFKLIVEVSKFSLAALSGFTVSVVLNLIIDTYYFGSSAWIATTWNFIRYNADLNNLKQHGLHPWHLHFSVNMILLFGPLSFVTMVLLFKKLKRCLLRENRATSCDNSSLCLPNFMLFSALTPVLILSCIPHKEPRFISSIIVPLIFCASCNIRRNHVKFSIPLWIVFNTFGVLWFGFFHQAGIVSAASYLNIQLRHPTNMTHSVLSWRTYMVPKTLIAISEERVDVRIHNLGGSQLDEYLPTVVQHRLHGDSAPWKDKIWLICPSSQKKRLDKSWSLKKQFFPHVSTEHLPMDELVKFLKSLSFQTTFSEFVKFVHNSFSLNLYEYAV